MRWTVNNVHERELASSVEDAGALIDSLASVDDRLWPAHAWPRMKFDRPLGIGAARGHGPIRYFVEEYDPGRSILFRFTGPKGLDGFHAIDVRGASGSPTVLRHRIEMRALGLARITWPLLFEPLHDALIEDAFEKAQVSLGLTPERTAWSPLGAISPGRTRRKKGWIG